MSRNAATRLIIVLWFLTAAGMLFFAIFTDHAVVISSDGAVEQRFGWFSTSTWTFDPETRCNSTRFSADAHCFTPYDERNRGFGREMKLDLPFRDAQICEGGKMAPNITWHRVRCAEGSYARIRNAARALVICSIPLPIIFAVFSVLVDGEREKEWALKGAAPLVVVHVAAVVLCFVLHYSATCIDEDAVMINPISTFEGARLLPACPLIVTSCVMCLVGLVAFRLEAVNLPLPPMPTARKCALLSAVLLLSVCCSISASVAGHSKMIGYTALSGSGGGETIMRFLHAYPCHPKCGAAFRPEHASRVAEVPDGRWCALDAQGEWLAPSSAPSLCTPARIVAAGGAVSTIAAPALVALALPIVAFSRNQPGRLGCALVLVAVAAVLELLGGAAGMALHFTPLCRGRALSELGGAALLPGPPLHFVSSAVLVAAWALGACWRGACPPLVPRIRHEGGHVSSPAAALVMLLGGLAAGLAVGGLVSSHTQLDAAPRGDTGVAPCVLSVTPMGVWSCAPCNRPDCGEGASIPSWAWTGDRALSEVGGGHCVAFHQLSDAAAALGSVGCISLLLVLALTTAACFLEAPLLARAALLLALMASVSLGIATVVCYSLHGANICGDVWRGPLASAPSARLVHGPTLLLTAFVFSCAATLVLWRQPQHRWLTSIPWPDDDTRLHAVALLLSLVAAAVLTASTVVVHTMIELPPPEATQAFSAPQDARALFISFSHTQLCDSARTDAACDAKYGLHQPQLWDSHLGARACGGFLSVSWAAEVLAATAAGLAWLLALLIAAAAWFSISLWGTARLTAVMSLLCAVPAAGLRFVIHFGPVCDDRWGGRGLHAVSGSSFHSSGAGAAIIGALALAAVLCLFVSAPSKLKWVRMCVHWVLRELQPSAADGLRHPRALGLGVLCVAFAGFAAVLLLGMELARAKAISCCVFSSCGRVSTRAYTALPLAQQRPLHHTDSGLCRLSVAQAVALNCSAPLAAASADVAQHCSPRFAFFDCAGHPKDTSTLIALCVFASGSVAMNVMAALRLLTVARSARSKLAKQPGAISGFFLLFSGLIAMSIATAQLHQLQDGSWSTFPRVFVDSFKTVSLSCPIAIGRAHPDLDRVVVPLRRWEPDGATRLAAAFIIFIIQGIFDVLVSLVVFMNL